MPPNACLLHQRLDLKEGVFAFDFNSACAGFVHGLALADGLIRSGRYRNLLLINADTYSKFTHSKDRSTRVLFGDGAAATWLTATDQPRGIRDCLCATQGKVARQVHHSRRRMPIAQIGGNRTGDRAR
jgi:3-oxoacyl-[acyl-carrier-protein] synthase-3